MTERISRRRFLVLFAAFAGGAAVLKAPRLGSAIGRPPETVHLRRAYGLGIYGQGGYGSARISPTQPRPGSEAA